VSWNLIDDAYASFLKKKLFSNLTRNFCIDFFPYTVEILHNVSPMNEKVEKPIFSGQPSGTLIGRILLTVFVPL
jgi:hypothetical protein